MMMSPPLDVFWVTESLLYPCRAELYVVGRRTLSGAATALLNSRVLNKLPITPKLTPESL